MYFLAAEHNPPHVHVAYGGDTAEIEIRTGTVLEGDIPGKALSLVREWIDLNKAELFEMWETQEMRSIPPL